MLIAIPLVLVGGGLAALIALALSGMSEDGPVPVHEPDIALSELPPQMPGLPPPSRYKKVNAILPQLQMASISSGIPLGVLVGWIARESGGRIDEVPKPLKGQPDGERGYFQLHPDESKGLGLDHQRLSVDPQYSINAGLLLIGKYMKLVDSLNVASHGSHFFWMLVKLAHTMGSGSLKIIVNGAKAAGVARTWDALKEHALENEARYFSLTRHSPKKWFPLVDKTYEVGAPYGFGGADTLVGAAAFSDIVDPLDCLKS